MHCDEKWPFDPQLKHLTAFDFFSDFSRRSLSAAAASYQPARGVRIDPILAHSAARILSACSNIFARFASIHASNRASVAVSYRPLRDRVRLDRVTLSLRLGAIGAAHSRTKALGRKGRPLGGGEDEFNRAILARYGVAVGVVGVLAWAFGHGVRAWTDPMVAST